MAWYTDDMANLYSTEVLSGVWQLISADRNALPAHPALLKVPAPPGSVTVRVPELDFFGVALLVSQTNQETDVADTAVTDTASDIVLSRYSKRHDANSFAQALDANGLINPQQFAIDAMVSYASTIRDMHANLVDNFATTQGSTGVDASFANFLDCITSLEVAEAVGPILAILHPVQWADIRKDLALNSGGAIQMNDGSQAVINAMKGLGAQGSLAGVDVFTTTSVPTANAAADRAGGLFTRGALVHAVSRPVADPDLPQIVLGSDLLFEKDRDASVANTEYVSHAFMGIIEGLDNKGVSLITDA